MIVVYKQEAKITIYEISDFIDSVNTDGAGDRWTVKLTQFVEEYALSNVHYALCQNESLASSGFSCINFNDWIIAFKIEGEFFTVHKIIRGSILI